MRGERLEREVPHSYFMIHRSRAAVTVGVIVGAVAFALRLYGLGSVLTVDEPQWIFRSHSFYRALEQGDLGGTFQGTHPGVVPMLLIGGGIRLQERMTGHALESPVVGGFRYAAKFPVALAVSAGLGLAALLVARLWGLWAGLGAGVLLALDPQLLGHAQLAHVDAVLSTLMLLSALSLALALHSGANRHLLLAGFWTGLAVLTKLPALVLLPVTAGMLLLHAWRQRGSLAAAVRPACLATLRWGAIAAGTFVLLWPSMWINALPNVRYAARDTRSAATLQPIGYAAESTTATRGFYLRALTSRMSPAMLFLAVGGLLLLWRTRNAERRGQALLFLSVFIGLLVLLSATGKRADRYALPLLPVIDVLAGIGLAALVNARSQFARAPRLLAVGIIAGLAIQAPLLAPYALAYTSPLRWREEPTQSGWGEGLEEAARILNTHPLTGELFVASWYPAVFREFFRGQTMSLSSRDDPRVSFVVLYRNMRGRGPDNPSTAILGEYANKRPGATIRVLGQEQAWIYQTDSLALFPATVGELVRASAAQRPGVGKEKTSARAVELGQFVVPEEEIWSGVRIAFATFSSRRNTGDVLVHIRDNPDGPDLRTVRLNTQTLEDGQWQVIAFPSLAAVKGKRHYVAVTSPTGVPGNAITVRYQPVDILPGSAVVLRQPLRTGEHREQFQHTGDLAVDLLYAAE